MGEASHCPDHSVVVEEPKPGRPRKDDEETTAKLLACIEGGAFAHVAASAAGIHRATFYRWMQEDEAFRDKVDAAAARARQKAEGRVFRDDPKAWLRYGPGKTRVDADGWTETTRIEHAGSIQTGPTAAELAALNPDELRRLHELLAKASQGDTNAGG